MSTTKSSWFLSLYFSALIFSNHSLPFSLCPSTLLFSPLNRMDACVRVDSERMSAVVHCSFQLQSGKWRFFTLLLEPFCTKAIEVYSVHPLRQQFFLIVPESSWKLQLNDLIKSTFSVITKSNLDYGLHLNYIF